jgi:CHAD domain-containing protein
MAKAREIPGLTTDLPYGEVAARVLEIRCEELIDSSENVLDLGDIERVHDMRVASRRLRAAIEIFRGCYTRDEARRALRSVKAVADALGERRDRDVAIEALEAFRESMPAPDQPGIRSLVETFRREQGEANEALGPAVGEAQLAELHYRVTTLVEAARLAAGGTAG